MQKKETKTNALLIVGSAESGKTALAKFLTHHLGNQMVMFAAHMTDLGDRFAFNLLNGNTKVVVIDDVPDEEFLYTLYNCITEGFEFELQGHARKVIHPALICTSDKIEPARLDLGTLRRFEIINMDDTTMTLGSMLRFGNEVLARKHYALQHTD